MHTALLLSLYVVVNGDATRLHAHRAATVACGNRVVAIKGEAVASEVCGEGVVRVDDGVTAVDRMADAIASVPLLDSRSAVTEGQIAGRIAGAARDGWWSDIGVINPGEATAVVLFGGQAIDVPAQGMRIANTDAATFTASRPVLVFRIDRNAASGARVITLATVIPRRRHAVQFPSSTPVAVPHTVTLTPSKDNTLYEASDGSLSNGSGPHLFVGATGSLSLRRALVAFNVGSQIPPGSTVTSATLTMHVSRTISGGQPVALHAVSKDWGEGASNAGVLRDGGGASAQNGDATWIHTFFPNQRWSNAGGDFAAAVDASVNVSDANPIWASSAAMVARVQGWVDQPSTNFGWILIGNEPVNGSTKEFNSRESTSESVRPSLTIDFTTH